MPESSIKHLGKFGRPCETVCSSPPEVKVQNNILYSIPLCVQSQWRRTVFLLLFSCMAFSPIFAACHAVTPSGSGSKSGADWNNAYSGLPSKLVRGDIYYLADGNYGNHLSIATSGSGTLELRKAQSYDYGSGCGNSIAAGWNTSTMGSAQAYWQSTGSGKVVTLGSEGDIIINGNGNNAGTDEIGCGGVAANPPSTMKGPAPHPAACGIRIDDSTCTSTATNGCDGGSGVINGGGDNITFESVELFGQGQNSNGNNNSETYFWFANGGNLANVTITHCYCHNAGTTYFTVVSGGWNDGSFDHNYVWGLFDGSTNHGEAVQLQGSNGVGGANAIHHNIFRDQQTNGDVVAVISGTQTYAFYDNVDFCSVGGTSTSCRHNDGVIGCFNSQTCSDVLIYNNTFNFPSDCGWNVTGGPSSMTVENNLWYNCGAVTMQGGTNTVDYNSYLNSHQSAVGSHDISISSSVSSPFVSSTNFKLASENANWSNRLRLASPYDVDAAGFTFTTDRGAYQYVATATPSAPLNLAATVK